MLTERRMDFSVKGILESKEIQQVKNQKVKIYSLTFKDSFSLDTLFEIQDSLYSMKGDPLSKNNMINIINDSQMLQITGKALYLFNLNNLSWEKNEWVSSYLKGFYSVFTKNHMV